MRRLVFGSFAAAAEDNHLGVCAIENFENCAGDLGRCCVESPLNIGEPRREAEDDMMKW